MNMSLASLDHLATLDADRQLKRAMSMAVCVVAALGFGLGTTLALIPISSAVVAVGEISVASHVKKIAHPRGGVIAAIPVSNGDRVRAGQLLLRLDTSVSAASVSMVNENVYQLMARTARLRAERDALDAIPFPAELLTRRRDPVITEAMRAEQRVFELNRAVRRSLRAALAQQIHQAEQAIRGYGVQVDAYRKQSALIAEEQAAYQKLWEKQLTTLRRVNEINRVAVGLDGSAAATQTSAAQMKARIAQLREQMIVIDQDARSKAGAELGPVETRLTELRQDQVVATDTNTRNLLKAPYDGVVDKLAFATIGGVIQAGETIMEIVPDRDPFIVSARVRPADIDQLQKDMDVSLRFSAFNMQTTPQIAGRLIRIGANRAIDDDGKSASYFPVEIAISQREQHRLGALKLRAGMPVEAFIRTGDRTLLGYLVKPLRDQLTRAFREN